MLAGKWKDLEPTYLGKSINLPVVVPILQHFKNLTGLQLFGYIDCNLIPKISLTFALMVFLNCLAGG